MIASSVFLQSLLKIPSRLSRYPHCNEALRAVSEDKLLIGVCKQEIGDMAYTIIRPGGLKNEAGNGQGVLTENNNVCGAIHREDVAALVVKALFSNKSDGKVIHL